MKQKIIMIAVIIVLVVVTILVISTDKEIPNWLQAIIMMADFCAIGLLFSNWDDHDDYNNKTRLL